MGPHPSPVGLIISGNGSTHKVTTLLIFREGNRFNENADGTLETRISAVVEMQNEADGENVYMSCTSFSTVNRFPLYHGRCFPA